MATTRKMTMGVIAAAALALSTGAAFADHFVGTWKVKDSAGKDFEIVVAKDGTATGSRAEGMKGKWVEEGDAVTITWDTGWKTKIAKDGAGYKKTGYQGDTEKGSSAAELVK